MDERRKLLEQDGDLQLWENQMDGKLEYELMVNGVFIMASYNALSSERMVEDAVRRYGKPGCKVLIGGLGLGYSVQAALRCGDLISEIQVVELNKQVIDWNRTILHPINHGCLEDPKVTIHHGDFIEYIRRTDQSYDAICMDIDNGPMLLSSANNQEAYSLPFFKRVFSTLNPGGVFTVWSCGKAPELLQDMGRVFSSCEEEEIMETLQRKEFPYYLYFGILT